MPNPVDVTTAYLKSTRDILAAARQLRSSLGTDPAAFEGAVQGLEQAAMQHQSGGMAFRQFLYREAESAAEQDKPEEVERAVQGSLVAALAELQAGNVLIASGQAGGEVALTTERKKDTSDPPPQPSPLPPVPLGGKTAAPKPTAGTRVETLDVTIAQLEITTEAFEANAGGRRFAFLESAVVESTGAVDVETFRGKTRETLATVVSEAADTVSLVLQEASKLSVEKMTEALGKLGERLPTMGRIGRLIRLGIDKVRAALDWLIDLVGADALSRAREKVLELWENLKSGQLASNLLERLYNVQGAREEVDQILGRTGLRLERIGPAAAELGALAVSFKGDMEIARTMTTAVTVTGGLLSLMPALGGQALLAAATIDGVILGVVVLLGMGCTNTGLPLHGRRGVLQIARDLGPEGQQP